jgi:N-acetylmuramic acid 6-phosphate etherase
MIVIGLMSGTSADGIDAAVVAIEGAPPALRWRLLAHVTQAYPETLQREIMACCDPRTGSVDRICTLSATLGQAFGKAALEAAAAAGIYPAQIDLIGSHGQTIWHAPQNNPPATLQIGSAAEIAEHIGAAVVSDFRPRDMAAGGQGAPLVAAVDALLLAHPTQTRAAQNIGGIANVTFIPPQGQGAFAFDTGPGNLLIDDAMRRYYGLAFDRAGAIAASGQVHAALLAELLAHPFLHLQPPKTTGREAFGAAHGEQIARRAAELGLAPADLVATLTAFTAQSIALAYRAFLPHMPDEVIVSGGGARNQALMAQLGAALGPIQLSTSDSIGIPIEAKEALAFAVLAYETWHGRPGNLPAATGATHPVVLGSITPGSSGRWHATPHHAAGTTLTESRNPASASIDTLPTLAMLELINREDALVAGAVAAELPTIAQAVDQIAARMRAGGRLIYIGAGTSGRLGALDAAECPPTYSTPAELVIAVMAGGTRALTHSVEGAEDDPQAGAHAVLDLAIAPNDSLVGIAASGTTPYVCGALRIARERGALTVSLACNHPSAIAELAEIAIAPLVGPEVITGSTRMKAGTAQKLVLNMLSTGAMIRLGKTYGNLMVDMQASNTKLKRRATRIVAEATGLERDIAAELLEQSHGEVKTAIVAALAGINPAMARERLAAAGGIVRAALFQE